MAVGCVYKRVAPYRKEGETVGAEFTDKHRRPPATTAAAGVKNAWPTVCPVLRSADTGGKTVVVVVPTITLR